ncbi:MAG: hypothetical protein QM714_03465 [Nocardioides sp.]|uniref:hypothetical protein n=1 Tax=Nocardioides sp. TaxID=35761 RepID=UPI0039E4D3DF
MTPITISARTLVAVTATVGMAVPVALAAPSLAASSTESTVSKEASAKGHCVRSRQGIPQAGKTYLGAAVNGTHTIGSRERQLGRTIRLHRSYYNANQISGAVRDAKADLKAGRLPWISFKAPYSWSQMAAGNGNRWAKELARGLRKVHGPVWLAVHHEPEKDGDLALWTKMQRQIAPIIHARTNNVAYTVIYSGWNTYGGGRNTVATKWPGNANIDILAIDAYSDYGVRRAGGVGDKHLDVRPYFRKMARWARHHHTAWAVAEIGQSRPAAKDDPKWLVRAYHTMQRLGGAGMSYFDSNKHSVTDWTLDDPVKFARYRSLMPLSARLCGR